MTDVLDVNLPPSTATTDPEPVAVNYVYPGTVSSPFSI